MNLEKLLMNPIRIMIMQYLTTHETATASEIISIIDNVSRATVYNHIKILEENGLLCVVKENQIRGTIEKVFSLNKSNKNFNTEYTSIINCLIYLMVDFQNYFEDKPRDIKSDMLFVDRTILFLDKPEFENFFQEYTDLCKRYFKFSSAENRTGRTISLISSPFVDNEN